MNQLEFVVVGNGGREHCLVEILREWGKVYSLGGSDRIREVATPLDPEKAIALSAPLSDEMISRILEKKEAIVVIGPEQPLSVGWVDQILEKNPHHKILGPGKRSSQLETSKWWAKELMEKYRVPTARALKITKMEEFSEVISQFSPPYVVKADGLAAGKGVAVCATEEKARDFVMDILEEKAFGDQAFCLMEEYLEGRELSVFMVLDGNSAIQIGIARDYKRLQEGDKGPNTGGMGAYSPLPDMSAEDEINLFRSVIRPLLSGLHKEELFYKGFLYLGLIKKEDSFKVLEINVRLGDPETQVVLPLLRSRIADLFSRAVEGQLSTLSGEEGILQIDSNFWMVQPEGSAICVVLAAPGYPPDPQRDISLPGLDGHLKVLPPSQYIFLSGTRREGSRWTSSGGRVLSVVTLHHNLQVARQKSYEKVAELAFTRLVYRRDIAQIAVREREGEVRVQKPLVSIVMGSASDLPTMQEASALLTQFNIPYEIRILSAHRSPDAATEFAHQAEKRGIEVIIVGAGGAAHLAGHMASYTVLPIVSVPMLTSSLGGLDSLYSIVQMPSGIPVATMAIGKAGAKNAAIMAAVILGGQYPDLRETVRSYKQYLAKQVLKDDQDLQQMGVAEFLKSREPN